MTNADKITILQTMTEETDSTVLSTYLDIAGSKVIQRAYPFRTDVTVVPDKYSYVQIEIAAYLINKRGAEGETVHNENGINRSYEDGDVPPTLLRQIVPFAGVVGG